MAQRRITVWAVGLAAALALAGVALAQVSTNFDLSWHLLSGGGGSRSSTHYQLDDSLGQWAGGVSSSAGYELASGFWYGLGDGGPSWLDDYELDDTCGLANTIATDGSVQTHTFHDAGDEDWVKFQAQADKTYVIRVNNVGDNVDAVVMLHGVCNSPPLVTEENAFGPTVELSWNCADSGEYYLGLVQNDPSLYGEGTNYDLSVSVDTEPPSAPAAIRVDPSDQTLSVQWSKSPEPDVASYLVRWGLNDGGPYGSFQPVDGADNTFYQITGLTNGLDYYIVITAFDFSGNESPYSIQVGEKPRILVDLTQPTVTVTRPATTPYTTTVAATTVGGTAEDSGGNLSRVRVHNTTNGAEGWAYNLSGASASFLVESIPLAVGENQIEVTAYDVAENTGTSYITIRRLVGLNGAVVIAGGQNNSSSLQSNINHATNYAYRIFQAAGFGADDIYYLSPSAQDADADGVNDVDATMTPSALQAAIIWATDRVGPEAPLYLYMMDHGGIEAFCGSDCTVSGRIDPQQLDGWLDTLETTSGCDLVNVIIDACHSGSFIDRVDDVLKSLSEDGRVVIASTGRTNNAYASAQGAYFSDAFFSAVAEGSDLLTCFSEAKAAVASAGVPQTPWMDDNGDGLYTAQVDGTYADDRYVASYFGTLLPEITASSIEIVGSVGSIEAQVVRGDEPIQVVWAAVYAPSFQAPTETTLELGVPLIQLEAEVGQNDTYSAQYNAFGEEGSYRVVIYAQDEAGNFAAPRAMRTGTSSIYLPLLLRNQAQADPAPAEDAPESEQLPEEEQPPEEEPSPEPEGPGVERIFLPLVVKDHGE